MPLRDPEVWRTVCLISRRSSALSANAAQLYGLFQQTRRAPHDELR